MNNLDFYVLCACVNLLYMFNENEFDPDVSQFVSGFANELQQRQQQPPPRRRSTRVIGDDGGAGVSTAISITAKDLLDAFSKSNSHAPAAPVAKPQDIPWGLIVALGIGVGVAVGIGIAVLSSKHR